MNMKRRLADYRIIKELASELHEYAANPNWVEEMRPTKEEKARMLVLLDTLKRKQSSMGIALAESLLDEGEQT